MLYERSLHSPVPEWFRSVVKELGFIREVAAHPVLI